MSFFPNPILELFNILLALMHGIKEYFSNSFFSLLSFEGVTLMPWDELGANQLAYRLCLKVVFPSWILLKKIIPTLIEKMLASMCNLHHQPICQPLALSTFGCQHCLHMSYLLLWLVLS
jgi:hypothetical protein